MADDPQSDFEKRWGVAPAEAPTTAPAPVSPAADFERRWSVAAPGAPASVVPLKAETAQETIARATSGIGAAPRAASAQPLAEVLASPDAQSADIPQSQAAPPPATIENVRSLFAAPEGWRTSGILPIRIRETETPGNPWADIRPDWGPVRSVVNPLLDLLEGTKTGKVTPEATALLAGTMMGNPNPLAARAAIMRPSFAGAPLTPIELQTIRDKAAPLSSEFRAAPGVTEPSVTGPVSANPDVPASLAAPTRAAPSNALAVGSDGRPLTAEGQAAAANAGAPQGAVGADVSRAPAPDRTRGQAQTDLMKDVTQTAADRAGPQGADNTTYVPGTVRTTAGRDFSNPANAVNEKTLRETDPVFDAHLRAIEKNNNEAMTDYYLHHAGDPNAIEAATAAREALTPDRLKLFHNEQSVDAQPIAAKIDEILASPAGKQKAVRTYLNDVRDSLYDADGNLETSPSQLYGARKNLTDLLSKAKGSSAEAADIRNARAQLMTVKDALDPVIAKGAPGFQSYLQDYAAASKPIDAMQFMQGFLSGPGKITDAQGVMQLSRVQKVLEKIAKDRAPGAPATNPAQALTDDQIQAIVNIRNELAANSYKDQLARTKGSDTTQKLNAAGRIGTSPVGAAVRGAADLAMHGALLGTTGGFGNLMYQYTIKPAVAARRARQAEAVANTLKSKLLETTPPPNLLAPP